MSSFETGHTDLSIAISFPCRPVREDVAHWTDRPYSVNN